MLGRKLRGGTRGGAIIAGLEHEHARHAQIARSQQLCLFAGRGKSIEHPPGEAQGNGAHAFCHQHWIERLACAQVAFDCCGQVRYTRQHFAHSRARVDQRDAHVLCDRRGERGPAAFRWAQYYIHTWISVNTQYYNCV